MSLDQQLPDLLTDAAKGADAAPPSIDGVHAALGRRTRRRQHQRLAASLVAAAVVAAGIVGGFALAGGGGEPAVPASTTRVVPTIGIDLAGFRLVDSEVVAPSAPSAPVVHFTARSSTGKLFTIRIDPEPSDGALRPDGPAESRIDLDGDGQDDGAADGILRSAFGSGEITWRQDDGRLIHVAATRTPISNLVAYVTRDLDRDHLDLATAQPPRGRYQTRLTEAPAPDDAPQTRARYRDGAGGSIEVVVTPDLGRFDNVRAAEPTYDASFDDVPLGASILGPGDALVSASSTTPMALIRTDAGLTVEIRGDDVLPEVMRRLVTGGRFTDLSTAQGSSEVPTVTTPSRPQEIDDSALDPSGGFLFEPIDTLDPPPGNRTFIDVRRFARGDRFVWEFRHRPSADSLVAWDVEDDQGWEPCDEHFPTEPFVKLVMGPRVSGAHRHDGPVVGTGHDIGLTWCSTERVTVFAIPLGDADRVAYSGLTDERLLAERPVG